MAGLNRKFLLIKLHYFTYFAGVASLWSFVQVSGRQLGISEVNIGAIFTFAPMLGCISNPLFGAIADKFRIRKIVFLVFIFFNLVLCLSFASLPYRKPVNTDDNDALLHACSTSDERAGGLITTTEKTELGISSSRMTETNKPLKGLEQIEETGYTSPVFWIFAILVMAEWTAMAVVTSIADHFCFQTLGDKPHLYGSQRQWGAVGWGGATLLAGILIDYFSEPNQPKNYTPCFYLVGIFLTSNFIVSAAWKVPEEEKAKTMSKNLTTLILQPKISLFVLACIAVGIMTGLQWNFLYWYVEDLANAAPTQDLQCAYTTRIKIIQGLLSAVQCVFGEVPFFYLSGWFQRKLGHENCMTMVFGAFGLRFLCYSLLQNPWHVLPIEVFQGFTYGIFYSTMASYAFIISPPGTGATVQSFVAAAFEGLGVGFGSILAGFSFMEMSGRNTFRLYGSIALLFALIHYVASRTIQRRYDYGKPGKSDLPEGADEPERVVMEKEQL